MAAVRTVRSCHYLFFSSSSGGQRFSPTKPARHNSRGGGKEVRIVVVGNWREMATEWSDGGEEFLLPDEFLDDDFFSEEEKAAVAARSDSSDEEDCLAGLSRRLAGLLGDDGERDAPPKVV